MQISDTIFFEVCLSALTAEDLTEGAAAQKQTPDLPRLIPGQRQCLDIYNKNFMEETAGACHEVLQQRAQMPLTEKVPLMPTMLSKNEEQKLQVCRSVCCFINSS